MLSLDQTQNLWNQFIELGTLFGSKIISAILVFLFGIWLAKQLQHFSQRFMLKAQLDRTLIRFLTNLIYIIAVTFVVIATLGQLGIQTTSFIAVIGTAGLAIALALQGSLSNFASGVLIIIFHPFRVDDYIEGGGVAGIVEEIQIFTTILKTPDNKTIIVPNSKLYGDNIVNHSSQLTRRIDLTLKISYEQDLDQIKTILAELAEANSQILTEPQPEVNIDQVAAAGITLILTVWVATPNYSRVRSNLNENLKKSFETYGIKLV